jgi:GNAT superfamily N-acetyltransferase
MAENEPAEVRFRAAHAGDAEQVAALHAASWRRHYRGAYADSYLDGDVVADRRAVWSARLADPAGGVTVLAEDGDGLAGFVHVVLDEDAAWGSLVDNLHVALPHQRTGVGTALLARAAEGILGRAAGPAIYLWVLEQNVAAQRFYRARGGACVEKALVPPPGGVPTRLNGAPAMLRVAWPDASALAHRP